MKHYEVIVIGGGHAGVEAASASARLGVSTALITMKRSDIGVMSCNPAIGGLGKGHLVREVDALDGLMGRVADKAGIQFRLLNRRKGPAVQGPRAQADRAIYRREMLAAFESQDNVDILEGEVSELALTDGRISGVFLKDGSKINASAVVLTTGTFLRGIIHIGDVSHSGGRMGDDASVPLAEQIKSFDLGMGRLKTGTPPRLDGRTIDWDILGSQAGDTEPVLFSFMSKRVTARQINCGITETNPRTHEIIKANLSRSAMYGGHIEGVGPRYCPSIEDKVVRFADKDSHQVFLEPEGLDDYTVYPNGISTSLPVEVQHDYVRSMRGLENVEILQPGYAIEYDFVDPRALDMTLQLRTLPGLYLAGQINGTTGYEEAAAQGLVAGLNAGLASQGRPEEVFSRTDSYIGVMIDDLTTRGVSEPYRMFTSRAEFRLSLRADNADQRLTPRAIRLGCISEERREQFNEKSTQLASGAALLRDKTYTTQDLAAIGKAINHDGVRRTPYQLLSFPDISFGDLIKLDSRLSSMDHAIQIQFERDALYANYLDRQLKDIAALQKDDRQKIPGDFDFHAVSGLSTELRDKLCRVRPANLGQAARVDGMTPAALTLILTHLRRNAERAA